MSRAGSYRELRVYRDAFALAMEVFGLASGFPDHEKYDLARQVRRSSRSVCANTAETRVHIEFAHACGYLPTEIAADLDARYDRLVARLTAMRTRPEKWAPRSRTQAAARKVVSHRRPSPPRTTPLDPPASAKKVDFHGQPSATANSAQAPTKQADSHGRPSAAATTAQERPMTPAARPESRPHREPPSTMEDARSPAPP